MIDLTYMNIGPFFGAAKYFIYSIFDIIYTGNFNFTHLFF